MTSSYDNPYDAFDNPGSPESMLWGDDAISQRRDGDTDNTVPEGGANIPNPDGNQSLPNATYEDAVEPIDSGRLPQIPGTVIGQTTEPQRKSHAVDSEKLFKAASKIGLGSELTPDEWGRVRASFMRKSEQERTAWLEKTEKEAEAYLLEAKRLKEMNGGLGSYDLDEDGIVASQVTDAIKKANRRLAVVRAIRSGRLMDPATRLPDMRDKRQEPSSELDDTLFGDIGTMSPEEREQWLKETEEAGKKHLRKAERLKNMLDESGDFGFGDVLFGDKFIGEQIAREIEEGNKKLAIVKAVRSGKMDNARLKRWRNVTENVVTGALDTGVANIMKAIAVAQDVYFDNPIDAASLYRSAQSLSAFTNELFPTDPARAHEFSAKLGNGLGTMLPLVGTGTIAQLVGMGPVGIAILTGISGAGMEAGAMYEEAVQQGATEDQAITSYLMGLGLGATEAVPIVHFMRGARFGFGVSRIGQRIDAGLRGGLEESAQETFQSIGENITASTIAGYDPDRSVGEGVLEAGEIAFILGGAFGFAFGGGGGGQRHSEQIREIKDGLRRVAEKGGRFADGAKILLNTMPEQDASAESWRLWGQKVFQTFNPTPPTDPLTHLQPEEDELLRALLPDGVSITQAFEEYGRGETYGPAADSIFNAIRVRASLDNEIAPMALKTYDSADEIEVRESGNNVEVSFPYNRERNERFKEQLRKNGIKKPNWDPSKKLWRVTGDNAKRVVDEWVAAENALEEQGRALDEKAKLEGVDSRYVKDSGYGFSIRTPFDEEGRLQSLIKEIPRAEWNRAGKYWHIPYRDIADLKRRLPAIEARIEELTGDVRRTEETGSSTSQDGGSDETRILMPDRLAPRVGTQFERDGKLWRVAYVSPAHRITEDDPSVYGSDLLGHEGERGAWVGLEPIERGDTDAASPDDAREVSVRDIASRLQQAADRATHINQSPATRSQIWKLANLLKESGEVDPDFLRDTNYVLTKARASGFIDQFINERSDGDATTADTARSPASTMPDLSHPWAYSRPLRIPNNLSFSQFIEERTRLDELLKKVWHGFPTYQKGPMGLTPDHVKEWPTYKERRAAYAALHDALRSLNQIYVKKYKAELREYRARQMEQRPYTRASDLAPGPTTKHEAIALLRSTLSKLRTKAKLFDAAEKAGVRFDEGEVKRLKRKTMREIRDAIVERAKVGRKTGGVRSAHAKGEVSGPIYDSAAVADILNAYADSIDAGSVGEKLASSLEAATKSTLMEVGKRIGLDQRFLRDRTPRKKLVEEIKRQAATELYEFDANALAMRAGGGVFLPGSSKEEARTWKRNVVDERVANLRRLATDVSNTPLEPKRGEAIDPREAFYAILRTKGRSFADLNKLADEIGVSPDTLGGFIDEAIERGYLMRTKNGALRRKGDWKNATPTPRAAPGGEQMGRGEGQVPSRGRTGVQGGTGEGRTAPGASERDRRAGSAPGAGNDQTDAGAPSGQDAGPLPGGALDTTQGQPDRRAKPDPRVAERAADRANRERESRKRRNWRIGPDDGIGEGGPKEKVRANIAAIETLRTLEAEGRPATDEEKRVLARYSGWGAFAEDMFSEWNMTKAEEWAEERTKLKDLLTAEEWEAARRSTLNAHYTSPDVIRGMWEAMRHLGFDGGKVLEPALGVGHFIGLQPRDLDISWTGIEIDPITAAIADKLYEASRILRGGYQDFRLPDDFFDASISNIPFGDFSVRDPDYKDSAKTKIHDFFFEKTLDKVRPGGVIAFITSSGTMDKKNTGVRTALASKADLLGAIRLPGGSKGAFAKNAGTEVTTDIIFLRKRLPGEPSNGIAWRDTVEIESPDGPIRVNEYFASNPDMMLGEMRLTGTMYRDRSPMLVGTSENLGERIAEAAKRKMAEGGYTPRSDIGHVDEVLSVAYEDGIKEGAVHARNGNIYRRTMGKDVPIKLSKKAAERVTALIELRDTVSELLRGQMPAEDRKALRDRLNAQYDAFVEKYGPINRTITTVSKRLDKAGNPIITRRMPNLASFREDPDSALVAALEIYDEATDSARKSAIFHGDVLKAAPEPVIKGPADALAVSLDQTGGVDIALIAERLGVSEDAAIEALGDRVYLDPEGEKWVQAELYLGGDVVGKLEAAKAAAKLDPRYERNVDALEKVQPEPLTRVDITVPFGASWVPAEDMSQFFRERLGSRVNLAIDPITRKWTYVGKPVFSSAAQTEFGTSRMDVKKIALAALNNVPLRVVDKDSEGNTFVNHEATEEVMAKIRALRDAFTGNPQDGIEGWVWYDDERAQRLEAIYNRLYNRLVPIAYDGSHLTLPGIASQITDPTGRVVDFDLRPHQRNAVWRNIVQGNTLLGHVVGAGKAQPLDAKILTPNGWVRMGDIRVGDMVIGKNGKPTRVTGVYPQGKKEIFKVSFSDGASTECCDEHLWLTQTYEERNYDSRAKRLGKSWNCAQPKVRQLSEIRNTLVSPHLNAKNHSIPIVEPVHFNAQPVPIDPYVMGVLIGDGCFRSGSVMFSTADKEIIRFVSEALPPECEVVHTNGYDYLIRYTGEAKYARRENYGGFRGIPYSRVPTHPIGIAIREMGLRGKYSYEKHIPDVYKYNSVDVRLSILRGLMDADGTVNKRGVSAEFTTTSSTLADDVIEIVRSLGGIATRREKRIVGHRVAITLSISMPPYMNPFRLKRKADRVVPKTKYLPRRYITGVESVGEKYAQCISVASDDQLYVTDDFIVTHNTFTMIASGMEMKRLGLIRLPAYVVPNHMLEQFAREFQQAYPSARILVASKEEVSAAKRKEFVAKVAANEWDAVIITHSSFSRIPMSNRFVAEHIRGEVAKLERWLETSGDLDNITIKRVEKAKEKLKAKLAALIKMEGKDDGLTFEETGIDYLFVDESHLFKKLGLRTRHQNVKGIDSQASQRATDLYMKIRYLERNRPGRTATFATGTPLSNTMAEVHTILRFLAEDKLEEAGISEFDDFASTFGQIVTGIELKADGRTLHEVTRFASFVNVPELGALYSHVADTVTADQLGIPRPELETGKPIIVEAEPSPEEEAIIEGLVKEAEELKGKPPEPGQRIMLNVVNDGTLVAIDGRLLDPDLPFNPHGKIAIAVENIHRIWKEGKDPALAQMVFLDRGTPGGDRLDLYADIRDRLVEKGIPKEQIAFIHDANNDVKKARLFAKVRSGEVRVLIGSTSKMGVGTNVQDKLVAMHHIDPTWTPAEIEQRDGRIVRQGNQNPVVSIYRYVTRRSMDAFRWQVLETKARFIAQFLSGANGARVVEDIYNPMPDAAEIKAAATGDPRIMELAELQKEQRELQAAKRAHEKIAISARRQIESNESRAAHLRKNIADYKTDLANKVSISGKNFVATIDGVEHRERKSAGIAIRNVIASQIPDVPYGGREVAVPLGRIAGFDLSANLMRTGSSVRLMFSLEGAGRYFSAGWMNFSANSDPVGLVRRVEAMLSGMPKLLSDAQAELASIEAQKERLAAQAEGGAFAQQPRLDHVTSRIEELTRALSSGRPTSAPSAPAKNKSAVDEFVEAVEELKRKYGTSNEDAKQSVEGDVASTNDQLALVVESIKNAIGTEQFTDVLNNISEYDRETVVEIANQVYGPIAKSTSKKQALDYIRRLHDVRMSARRGIDAMGGRSAGALAAPISSNEQWRQMANDILDAADKYSRIDLSRATKEQRAVVVSALRVLLDLSTRAHEIGLKIVTTQESEGGIVESLTLSLEETRDKLSEEIASIDPTFLLSEGRQDERPGDNQDLAPALKELSERLNGAIGNDEQFDAVLDEVEKLDEGAFKAVVGNVLYAPFKNKREGLRRLKNLHEGTRTRRRRSAAEGGRSAAALTSEVETELDRMAGSDRLYGVLDDHEARQEAQLHLALGEPYHIDPLVVEMSLSVAAEHLHMVPREVTIYVLESVAPSATNDSAVDIVLRNVASGKRLPARMPSYNILGRRAFTLSNRNAIILSRFGLSERFEEAVSGEIWHEVIHILRSSEIKDLGVGLAGRRWRALLDHARSLSILDMPFADFLKIVGDPGWHKARGTLRENYLAVYTGRSDLEEALDQEAVAHMVEMYRHGYFTDEDMAPVLDIIQEIEDGTLARGTGERSGTGTVFALSGTARLLNGLRAVAKGQAPEDIMRDVGERMEARVRTSPRTTITVKSGETFEVQRTKDGVSKMTYHVIKDGERVGHFVVEVGPREKPQGRMLFEFVKSGGEVEQEVSPMLTAMFLDPAYHRLGIATKIADLAEGDIGLKLVPPPLYQLNKNSIRWWVQRDPDALLLVVDESEDPLGGITDAQSMARVEVRNARKLLEEGDRSVTKKAEDGLLHKMSMNAHRIEKWENGKRVASIDIQVNTTDDGNKLGIIVSEHAPDEKTKWALRKAAHDTIRRRNGSLTIGFDEYLRPKGVSKEELAYWRRINPDLTKHFLFSHVGRIRGFFEGKYGPGTKVNIEEDTISVEVPEAYKNRERKRLAEMEAQQRKALSRLEGTGTEGLVATYADRIRKATRGVENDFSDPLDSDRDVARLLREPLWEIRHARTPTPIKEARNRAFRQAIDAMGRKWIKRTYSAYSDALERAFARAREEGKQPRDVLDLSAIDIPNALIEDVRKRFAQSDVWAMMGSLRAHVKLDPDYWLERNESVRDGILYRLSDALENKPIYTRAARNEAWRIYAENPSLVDKTMAEDEALDEARRALSATQSERSRLEEDPFFYVGDLDDLYRKETGRVLWDESQTPDMTADQTQVLFALSSVATEQGRILDELGFYSQALEAARNLKQAKGTPAQMLAMLKKAGVRETEIEATGLRKALESKKTVTKAEIVEALSKGRVKLLSVEKSDAEADEIIAREVERRLEIWRAEIRAMPISDEAIRNIVETRESEKRAEIEANVRDAFDMGLGDVEISTRYRDYSLDPGNPTYAENLIHLPAEHYSIDGITEHFVSDHFSEPNIVAFTLTSLMEGEQSGRTYLINQIQSDWGQSIRRYGERDAEYIDALFREKERVEDRGRALIEEALDFARTLGEDRYGVSAKDAMMAIQESDRPENIRKKASAYVSEIDALTSRLYELRDKIGMSLIAPRLSHPLVASTAQWLRTALHRSIRLAIEANANSIAIPSGDTVLSYNSGEEEGMRAFYDKIVPQAMAKIVRRLDRKAQPYRVETLDSPTGRKGLGKGFTIFPITDKMRRTVLREGLPMFALAGPVRDPAVAEAERLIDDELVGSGAMGEDGSITLMSAKDIPGLDSVLRSAVHRDDGSVFIPWAKLPQEAKNGIMEATEFDPDSVTDWIAPLIGVQVDGWLAEGADNVPTVHIALEDRAEAVRRAARHLDANPHLREESPPIQPVALAGMEELPNAPSPTPGPGVEPKPKSLIEVIDQLSVRFGVPILQGRLDPATRRMLRAQGAEMRGQYNPRTDTIRLSVAQSIDHASHEIGHKLITRLDKQGAFRPLLESHSAEVVPLAEHLEGPDALNEGFAEFIRYRLTNPAFVRKTAPAFNRAFDDYMRLHDPETLANIDAIGAEYESWLTAPSAGRLSAAVKSGLKPSMWKDIRNGFIEMGAREGAKAGIARVFTPLQSWIVATYRNYVNRQLDVSRVVAEASRIAEKNGIEYDFSAFNNVADWARKLDSFTIQGMALNDLQRGVHWIGKHGKGSATFFDALKVAFGGLKMHQWSDEMRNKFGTYLIARRGRWLWLRYRPPEDQYLGAFKNSTPPMTGRKTGDWYNDPATGRSFVWIEGHWEPMLHRPPDKHSREDHIETVRSLEAENPQFARAAEILYEFQNDLLRKEHQAGLWTDEELDYRLKMVDYVPWARDMSDRINGIGRGSARDVPVRHTLKGSYRDFVNPLETIVKKAYDANLDATRNIVKTLLMDMIEAVGPGSGHIGEMVPATEMFGRNVNVEEVLRSAGKQEGLDKEDVDDLVREALRTLNDRQLTMLFRPTKAKTRGDVIVWARRQGELRAIHMTDPDFARGLLALFEAARSHQAMDILAAAIRTPTRFTHRAVTGHPLFLIRNLIRDAWQAVTLVPGYIPFISNMRTVYDNYKRRQRGEQTWDEVLAAHGGVLGGLNTSSMQRMLDFNVEAIRETRQVKNPLRREFWTRTLNPAHPDFWRWAEWSEANTRQTIARIVAKRAKRDIERNYPKATPEQVEYMALSNAVHASRDYIDYGRHGDANSARFLRQNFLFINAWAQGLDKSVRQFLLAQTEDKRSALATSFHKQIAPLFQEGETRKPLTKAEKRALGKAMYGWVAIVGIAFFQNLIEMFTMDDDDLREPSEIMRTMYFLVPNQIDPYGKPWRIPRGFDFINVVSNAFRVYFDDLRDNDLPAMERFVDTLKYSLGPPGTMPILSLYMGLVHNKDLFTGRDIVSKYSKGVFPEDEYNAYTSAPARWIGKTLGVSPRKIEWAMQTMFADFGRDALVASRLLDPTRPSPDSLDIPIYRGLIIDPMRSSQTVHVFYDQVGADSGHLTMAAGSYKRRLDERADGLTLRKFLDRLDESQRGWAIMMHHYKTDAKRLHPLYRAQTIVRAINRMKRAVAADRVLDPDDDTQVLDLTRAERRAALTLLEQLQNREMANALIVIGTPGFATRKLHDTEAIRQELAAVSPQVAEAFRRSLMTKSGKALVYSFETIRTMWPEIRSILLDPRKLDEIEINRGDIEFDDLKAIATEARVLGLGELNDLQSISIN